jgi:hypothetical protein
MTAKRRPPSPGDRLVFRVVSTREMPTTIAAAPEKQAAPPIGGAEFSLGTLVMFTSLARHDGRTLRDQRVNYIARRVKR